MEENKEITLPESNTDSVTFDYNQLYGNNSVQPTEQPITPSASAPTIEETPIILEEPKAPTEVVSDIIPTFDTNALEEDIPDELKPKTEEKLIHTLSTETQQEKEQGRRNLLFLVIFFAVLIVAVLFIFPLLVGI